VAAPATCVHGGKAVAVLPTGRYCDWCYRNAPEFLCPCNRCGAEDHLNRDQLCRECRASDAIDAVFNEATLHAQPKLKALRDHLRLADARYVLLFRRRSNAWKLISQVAALRKTVTHAHLDSMGTPRSVSQVRSLLVHLEVLEERDEYVVAFERVAATELAKLTHRSDRLALELFIRWRQQRRRSAGPLTSTQASNDRNELRLLVSLISAFNADGDSVATGRQQTLDRWTRDTLSPFRARRFLTWCRITGINKNLTPPPYRRTEFSLGGTSTEANETALKLMLTEERHAPRIRLAVLLTVVYGIRAHRIAALRRDSFRIVNGTAVIVLGTIDLTLPAAATPWVEEILRDVPIKHRVGGSRRDDTWLFPGYRHGDHMLPSSLTVKLRALGVSPARAHQVATAAIITQVPPAVVARLLGVSVSTAAEWHYLGGSAAEHR
jgi:integrase